MTQPLVTALARKWAIDVNSGTELSPVWVTIRGINSLKYDPNAGNLEEDNAYDQDGRLAKTKTALGSMAELKLLRRYTAGDVTDYDAGQELLRTKSALFGEDGWAHCRIYDRNGGPEAYEDYFEVLWAADGGTTTDLEKVTVTLESKGVTAEIDNPEAVPIPAPTVTSLSPATGAAAGGTLVKIVGTDFATVTGATGVKFDATNATSYFVDDDQTIYAVAPAHAAGTVDVTVTNTTGTSSGAGTANDYVYV